MFQRILHLLFLNLLVVHVESFSTPTKRLGVFAHSPSSIESINHHNVITHKSDNGWNQNPSNWIHDGALFMSDDKNDGVVELVDDDDDEPMSNKATITSETKSSVGAPFLSQGEIQKEALELTNDPKQTRVIIYIIISLVPVLFLVPLMLGSRDLIPLDALPPVELN